MIDWMNTINPITTDTDSIVQALTDEISGLLRLAERVNSTEKAVLMHCALLLTRLSMAKLS